MVVLQLDSGVSPSEPIMSAFLRGHYDRGEYGEAWARLGELRKSSRKKRGGGMVVLPVGPSVLQDLMGVCVRREDWQVRPQDKEKSSSSSTTAAQWPSRHTGPLDQLPACLCCVGLSVCWTCM